MATTADFLARIDAPLHPPVLIPLDDIEPDPKNVRSDFRPIDGEVPDSVQRALGELADEIARDKLMHPITVRELDDGRYRIIVGERRWRAFRLNRDRGLAHYEAIPAQVRNDLKGSQLRLAQLAENLQREDVTDIDVARSLKETLEEYPELQKQQLAQMLKKPPSYISRLLALMDPKWAHVVDSGVITYASLLEQFRTLPEAQQALLVDQAKEQKRTITSGDIVKARKIPDAVQKDAASVLAAYTPPDEDYSPAHAAATRRKVDEREIVDHGGDPVLPSTPRQFGAAPLGHFDVDLTLAQIILLANADAFPEGAELTSQTVRISMTREDLKTAITSIGGDVPKAAAQLPMALIKRVNSFF